MTAALRTGGSGMSALAALVDQVTRAAETAHCLPAAAYRDPDFFALELEHVLRPGWHAVARFDDLPETGDYRALDLCGEPLLLVRDAKAELRLFSRVCRHRAHTVVEGAGRTKRFVCPYHNWSYGLDGRLKTAPLMEGIAGFDRAACGLPELRTEAWQGFVLTSLDAAASSPLPALAPLEEAIAAHGLGEMKSVGTLTFESPWNWKVMIDNFMESYHHQGTHAQTLQQTNKASATYTVALPGPFSLLANPGTEPSHDLYVGQVFPTLLFAVAPGLGFGTWYEMEIASVDRFVLRIHVLAPAAFAAAEGYAEAALDQVRKIHREDIEACQRVQQGLASRLWEPGPLSRHEASLTAFHDYLARTVRAGTGA